MGLRDIAEIYRALADAGPERHPYLKPWIALHRIDRSVEMVERRLDRLRDGYVDARREAETLRNRNRELEDIVNHDVQTGLPNRRVFDHDLEHMIGQMASIGSPHGVGLLLLGLDASYGRIRQTMGYTVGDTLLFVAAQRIQKVTSGYDSRLYQSDRGDEFIILLDKTDGSDLCQKLADELRDAVFAPHEFRGNVIRFGCHIGISVYPEHGENKEELLRNADTAMGEAHARKSPVAVYEARMGKAVHETMQTETELRRAIERGGTEFELHYQPLVDQRGVMRGSEALIRWRHPTRGLVAPGAFIGLAEENGLILPIGHWVLYRACEQLKTWHDKGYDNQYISVNLSARQLEMPNIVEVILGVLQARELHPRYLKIELTESSVMTDPEGAVEKINALRRMEIGVSIDDFGTGYSSLTYLKRFSVDTLKIDKSFVRDLHVADHGALVKTIVGMAMSLNIEALAEGVETREQRDYLVSSGCLMMQGYYFSPPVTATRMEEMLAQGGVLPGHGQGG